MHYVNTKLAVTLVAASCALVACAPKVPEVVEETKPTPAAAPVPVPTGPPLETNERNGVDYLPAFEGQTRVPGMNSGITLDVQVITPELDGPWAFELLPDGRYLVTERPGNLRIISADGKVSAPAKGLPKVAYAGQGGLLDVALDPNFATNKTIFWSYSEPRKGGNGTALAKGVLVEGADGLRVDNVKVIFQQMPTFDSGYHFGSRIAFTQDGKLFLTVGERALPAAMVQSQDLNSHFGKVIRLNLDGSVPADNPFVGRADSKPEIWSYGHRNVQAATIDSATGKLWTIEHGPRGGDELNQPKPGLNHGWPVISYGINYPGDKIGEGITARTGMEQPVYYWDPVIAPSGMIVYHGEMFPQWKGSIFVGGLASMKLVRLQMDGDKVVGEEWLLTDRQMRVRDVQQGADGAIYVIGDGPKSPLLKLTPQSVVAPKPAA
jgi:aldose sugar dehydrogenase